MPRCKKVPVSEEHPQGRAAFSEVHVFKEPRAAQPEHPTQLRLVRGKDGVSRWVIGRKNVKKKQDYE